MKDLKMIVGFLFCVMMVCADGQSKEKDHDSQPTAEDDSDMYMEPLEEDHQPASSNFQPQTQTGNWFPSFSRSYEPYDHQPSGHSRPVFNSGFQQQEGAYSQRNEPPFQQNVNYNDPKYNAFDSYSKEYQPAEPVQQQQQQPAVNDKSASILGDGNFGVIQGGTFYPEKDGYDAESSGGFDDFSSYFHNGHGRPSYFYPTNPKPGKQQQFDNFRDFADINSPSERQYSQYVVVYTNKNGTRTITTQNDHNEPENLEEDSKKTPASSGGPFHQNVHIDVKRPKNILESLALLDHTVTPTGPDASKDNDVMILTRTLLLPSYEQGDVIEIPEEKKASKSKRKLAKLVPEKKHEARLLQKAKDLAEPLLALS